MKYYLAPLEGITGYIFRNAYHTYFHPMDKYFTPFIKPNQKGHFSSREKYDIAPEHNRGMYVVPQILTNSAEDFCRTAGKLAALGYQEMNLNLGCPAKTVVNKKRGSGFLADPDELQRFLDEVFDKVKIKISIKTRIGKDGPEEFHRLLEIYNQYPLAELIIHPRIQLDFYKNKPNLEMFRIGTDISSSPLCYNGDIFTEADYQKLSREFPNLEMVMLGRGILQNPGLISRICDDKGLQLERVRDFHEMIYEGYQSVMSGERNTLYKMKELWFYLSQAFTEHEKYAKRIRKAERFSVYEDAVRRLFAEQGIRAELR